MAVLLTRKEEQNTSNHFFGTKRPLLWNRGTKKRPFLCWEETTRGVGVGRTVTVARVGHARAAQEITRAVALTRAAAGACLHRSHPSRRPCARPRAHTHTDPAAALVCQPHSPTLAAPRRPPALAMPSWSRRPHSSALAAPLRPHVPAPPARSDHAVMLLLPAPSPACPC